MNKPRDIFLPFNRKDPQKRPRPCVFEHPWQMVRQWYQTDLGQAFLHSEKQSLNKLLEQIFGYNLLQLGCLDDSGLTASSRTSFQYVCEPAEYLNSSFNHPGKQVSYVGEFQDLSIQSHSIDAVLLPHTLEFEPDPHQILREVERVLVAEGKVVIMWFNPFSLWGFWHKYWEIRNRIASDANREKVPLPSCGHLLSQKRLRDWLKLLGFDIQLVSEYFYRPPVKNASLLKNLEFMEVAGRASRLLPAGGYLMVATKRVSTLTPIPQKWKFTKAIIGSNTIEPAGFKDVRNSRVDSKTIILKENILKESED